ncbi:MAG: HDIG domain-containing protein [Planctomycetota bacterium]
MSNTDKRRRIPTRGEYSRPKVVSLENGSRLRKLRGRGIQLACATVTCAAIVVILAIGGPVFPYRIGEIADREIRLKVGLEIVNDTKTRNKQEEEARLTPLVLSHNPQPNIDLRNRILELARAVSKQTTLDGLELSLRSEWQLTPEMFQNLRKMLPSDEAVASFQTRLERVFEPIIDRGVLDLASLPPDAERETNRIQIFTLGAEQPLAAYKDNVSLTELSNPESRFAGQIKKQWQDPAEANTVFQLIVSKLKPTLVYDAERSRSGQDLRRQQVSPIIDKYEKSGLVVASGEEIGEDQLKLLREEEKVLTEQARWGDKFGPCIGLSVIVLAVFVITGFYLKAFQAQTFESPVRLGILCIVAIVTIGLARLLSLEPYHVEVLPIAVSCLLLAVAFQRTFALYLAFAFSVLVALVQPDPMSHFVVLMGGTAVGIMVLDSVRSRTKLITVGFYCALTYAGLSLALGLMHDQSWSLILSDVARRFGSGLIAGFLISGSLPFVESLFGIVTDISLIELADTSHPLLQELVRRAPGTYNHSVTVSIIAEAAAKRIGCNSLLVRVGALFHDIGKMLKPQYFIENKSQAEKNRHEHLAPAMSTLIIIGHVKDGMDLAYQHHMPEPIIDMIEQHHGTTLVDYFYHEAARAQKGVDDPDEEVDEDSFRYPGPKPRSKEAAVLMLADCVEGASRVLSEPTPASIEKLVHNLALNRLLDGQFDESGLTLEELRTVEESLTKSLTSVYHGRIKYPAAG